MLELRLTADAKRIASMRDAIERECIRAKAGAEHAEVVAFVIEQLVVNEVLVVVTVQSDATMLMVRDARPGRSELGAPRHELLERYAAGWTTMSGREGRTVWAEVKRTVALEPGALEPVADYRAPRDRSRVDERVARTGGRRPVPAGLRR